MHLGHELLSFGPEVTVGQQVCHVVLAAIEHQLPLEKALPCVFILAGVATQPLTRLKEIAEAHTLGGTSALCLDDKPTETE